MTDKELLEHYAGLALQGLLAKHGCYDEGRGTDSESYHCHDMAEIAETYAEALVTRMRSNAEVSGAASSRPLD